MVNQICAIFWTTMYMQIHKFFWVRTNITVWISKIQSHFWKFDELGKWPRNGGTELSLLLHSNNRCVQSVYYSAAIGERKYCDEHVCLCVCVCLSTIISLELHVRSSPNLLCVLPMAIALSSFGGIVICYVFPVLWVTSYLHVSQGCSTSPPGWGSEAHMHTRIGIPVAGSRSLGLLLAVGTN